MHPKPPGEAEVPNRTQRTCTQAQESKKQASKPANQPTNQPTSQPASKQSIPQTQTHTDTHRNRSFSEGPYEFAWKP